MKSVTIEYPDDWTDYALLDSGEYEKLERFGSYTIVRPDPRIIWTKRGNPQIWESADARFVRESAESGAWKTRALPPDPWVVTYNRMRFSLKPTDFKHVGLFPEQAVNWRFLERSIAGRPLNILNLFGYTGAATLFAARSGAHVTHVDSSRPSVTWANQWAHENSIPQDSVRWIIDDAVKFVMREQKRGQTYDAVIMDPPRFGRGAKGEVWKLETDLPRLLALCASVLSRTPAFVLLNAYTADLSAIALHNAVSGILAPLGGAVTASELGIHEHAGDRILPQGIVVRWTP